MGFFDKLKQGLSKTKNALFAPVMQLFASYDKVDDEFYDDLFDLLVSADVGAYTSDHIIEELRARLKKEGIKEVEQAKGVFRQILRELLGDSEPFKLDDGFNVLLIIGVNGAGKTTSTGKLAHYYRGQGKKVMLAAADTFRAAAIEQLEIWGDRANVPVIKQSTGADPSAVVFDAVGAAKKQQTDVLIADTAGRLHNKKNLLDELAKTGRVIDREAPGAHKETWLVLDATTGQNAISQVKEFGKASPITGLILTKLDGTAKGGFILSIKRELDIPVRFIGVGEAAEDLQPFDPDQFLDALMG